MRVIQRKTDNCQKEPNSTGPESRKGIVAQGLRMNKCPENKLLGEWVGKVQCTKPVFSALPSESLSTPY